MDISRNGTLVPKGPWDDLFREKLKPLWSQDFIDGKSWVTSTFSNPRVVDVMLFALTPALSKARPRDARIRSECQIAMEVSTLQMIRAFANLVEKRLKTFCSRPCKRSGSFTVGPKLKRARVKVSTAELLSTTAAALEKLYCQEAGGPLNSLIEPDLFF